VRGCGLISAGSEQGQVMGDCEHGYELSGSIEDGGSSD